MEFESVQKTAERLGVTVRAVQKWAAAGKLPGAEKVGRDWRIPAGISGPMRFSLPTDAPGSFDEKEKALPLPLLNGAFASGKCREYIDSLPNEDDRNIALGEYYYYVGRADMAAEILEPYLNSDNQVLQYSAELYYVFINIALGRTHQARFALHKLEQQVKEGLKTDSPVQVHAMGVMTSYALSVLLHQPMPQVPPLEEYLRYLPAGFKLWGCYILAYKEFQNKNYERALAISDLSMALVPNSYPIPMIYCRLVGVISLLGLMRVNEAKARFDELWTAVKADGFVVILAEHYGSLQGVIEAYVKKTDPENYEKAAKIVRDFGSNWIKLHNLLSGKSVAENLTTTEFTVAMLYNRGWSAQEIAVYMDLSENTVRGYIKAIYIKLGISDKKALAQFMIH